MNETFRFATAPVQLTAKADRPPRVSISAYNGGLMSVSGGWGPTVVDLSGVTIPASINLLCDHDGSLKGVVGTGSPRVVNNSLVVEGTLSRSSESARQIVALAAEGIEFGASIGLDPSETEFVRPGESITANGQRITATGSGFRFVKRGTLREISILTLPADASTTVSIAAASSLSQGSNAMDNQTPTTPTDATADTLQASREAAAAEFRRQSEITRICAAHPSIGEKALVEGWDSQRAELEVLRAGRQPTQTTMTTGHRNLNGRERLEASLMLRLNEKLAVDAYGAQVCEQARAAKIGSLPELCAAALRNAHIDPSGMGRDEMIRASFSQALISDTLSNVAGKSAEAAYRTFPGVAAKIARSLSTNDFKTHSGIRLIGDASLEELAETGEIRHGKLSDQKYDFSVKTYAKMFGLTRQDITNDDLGALSEVPVIIGRASAAAVEKSLFELILGNANSFFGVGNSNYASGADTAMGVDSLGSAIAGMMKATDPNGEPIGVSPRWLLVPVELLSTARQLYAGTTLVASGDTDRIVPAYNPFANMAEPITSPYLSADAWHASASAKAWYLLADANDLACFGVAYLSGRQAPTVETSDMDFNKLGIQWRGYLDYGVVAIEHRAGYKMAGE